jgi:prolyl-tRNA editing enzyme YbaK/EbsC (Cys-tRNA(Pro) deacylase)
VFTVDGAPVVALVSGDRQLDEAALAVAAGGAHAGRADADAVRAATGFPVGGVPPFGHATDLAVYVDVGLLRFDEVWAAAGTPHVNFAIAPDVLVAATRGTVAAIGR